MHFILKGATFVNRNIGQLNLETGEEIATTATQTTSEEENNEE